MDVTTSLVIVLLGIGLLSNFIALITTGWVIYTDGSGIIQYSGLYQSCTIDECVTDWNKRPIFGQVVLFLMAASAAVTFLGVIFLLFAELKSKKILLRFAGSCAFVGGVAVGTCAALYAIRSVNDLQVAVDQGRPAFYYSYGLAWAAMGLCIVSAVIMLYKGCKATRTTVQRL